MTGIYKHHTGHFNRKTCIYLLIHVVNYAVSWSRGSSAIHKIMQEHVHQFIFASDLRNRGKCDLGDIDPGMVAGSDGLVWVFPKLLTSWDYYIQQSQEFAPNGAKNNLCSPQPQIPVLIQSGPTKRFRPQNSRSQNIVVFKHIRTYLYIRWGTFV